MGICFLLISQFWLLIYVASSKKMQNVVNVLNLLEGCRGSPPDKYNSLDKYVVKGVPCLGQNMSDSMIKLIISYREI